jgi:hypothetical protein
MLLQRLFCFAQWMICDQKTGFDHAWAGMEGSSPFSELAPNVGFPYLFSLAGKGLPNLADGWVVEEPYIKGAIGVD